MVTKNEIKEVHALRMKKVRNTEGLFVVEGPKVVDDLLRSDWLVERLYATENWEGNHNATITVSNKELERMSQLKTPNQVLAVVRQKSFDISATGNTVLALDGINDPGNLGTIIRTADWFGIDAIVCSNDCADAYGGKAVQSAMGSLFRLPFCYTDLPEFLSNTKASVYGACMEGQPIEKVEFGKPCVVVLGSESHGIRDEVLNHITRKVTIPTKGGAESLNVGVAAGIFCQAISR